MNKNLMQSQEKSRSILKLSHTSARRFLLKAGSYCTLDLPPYIEFEKLLDEISFEGPDLKKKNIRIDAAYVQKMLAEIVKDQDLSRYIL